ncbi:MAG TPA: amidohydrolase family protein [Steroidobacteraceae bacterium]|nr:amidohydrolase family protein [Steroidobacteraceae bacterium]
MSIVDAHCHVSPVWFEPVETLLFQMDRCGVAQATLVQLLGQFDNGYQQHCAARFPDRFVTVIAVDPSEPAATQELRRWAQAGATGVRLRPDARSPGDDPYAIWRAAQACGFAVSCVGTAAAFLSPAFAELAQAFPRLSIVLEHLAGWARPDCDGSATTRAGLLELARLPNVFLKVPGLGQLAKREPRLPAAGRALALEPGALVLEMLAAFGARRLMWGSDFPPVAAREGYESALCWTRELLGGVSASDMDLVFGGTARTVFRLPPP